MAPETPHFRFRAPRFVVEGTAPSPALGRPAGGDPAAPAAGWASPGREASVRVVLGPQEGHFTPAALDAFYLTRLQRERMDNKEDAGGKYGHFDVRALKTSRTHEAVVMHPLPRTDELAYELDNDPRAVYFEQAAAGVELLGALYMEADLVRFLMGGLIQCAIGGGERQDVFRGRCVPGLAGDAVRSAAALQSPRPRPTPRVPPVRGA